MRLFRRSISENDTVSVRSGAEVFEVILRRRHDARRFTLRVSQVTGEATLTMPQRGDVRAAVRFAEAHGDWIAARLRRVPKRIEFRPGAVALVRGAPHPIVWQASARAVPAIAPHPDGGMMILTGGDPRHAPRRVQEFLRREAARDLERAVDRHSRALGVRARSITLRDQRTRWGSCTAAGRLNFSWRLIMAPPEVLDYLAAHEVCHLREMNHSERFWALVYNLCPGTDEAEAWLKAHGASLHRYGVGGDGADGDSDAGLSAGEAA
ncbi:M48 family metallopeptidase [Camelimonas fluminis]|uniref:M48 family metallopeptidase n=2 Tax=Camelimonas fluminis TaxID=1576911 RepID=A0ABV7UHQ3_9HYPH